MSTKQQQWIKPLPFILTSQKFSPDECYTALRDPNIWEKHSGETEAQSPLPLMELESPRSVTLRCIHECQQHDITAEGDTGQEAMQQGGTAG